MASAAAPYAAAPMVAPIVKQSPLRATCVAPPPVMPLQTMPLPVIGFAPSDGACGCRQPSPGSAPAVAATSPLMPSPQPGVAAAVAAASPIVQQLLSNSQQQVQQLQQMMSRPPPQPQPATMPMSMPQPAQIQIAQMPHVMQMPTQGNRLAMENPAGWPAGNARWG